MPWAWYRQVNSPELVEFVDDYILNPPIPIRHHFPFRLALLSIQPQPPPGCRTIKINGKQHYLWRAVDQNGEVVDVFLQAERNAEAAKRF